MACCSGSEIDFKELRTPEQQELMQALAPLLLSGISRGATPFGGALSAPPDPSMMQAMNMMSMVGGQGPYNFPGFQWGPHPYPANPTPQEPPPEHGENFQDQTDNDPNKTRRRIPRERRKPYNPYGPDYGRPDPYSDWW